MNDGDRQFEKLLEVAQDQARATTAAVEIQRHQGTRLDAMQNTMSAQTSLLTTLAQRIEDQSEALRDGRESAARSVKEHVSLEIARSDRTWRVIAWILGAILAASNVVGPLVVRWVFGTR